MINNLEISVGAKMLLDGEIRNFQRSPNARKWNLKEKCYALALFKRGPRCYRFLRANTTLPSERTLTNVLGKVKLEPGVSPFLINALGKKIETGGVLKSKLVTLMFDEMYANEGLYYNIDLDKIEGFEDLGPLGRTQRNANHVLVFMIQGMYEDFKYPVGYFPINGTCPKETLAQLIPHVIRQVSGVGAEVVASVSDQGPTNRGAITILRSRCPEGQYENVYRVDDQIIPHLWDIPHVFKSMRNNLLTSDLCPLGKNKMRVDLAAQVPSESVASGMETFNVLSSGKYAAWIPTASTFRVHEAHWREMIARMEKWVFIRKGTGERHVPPCLSGFIDNLRTLGRICGDGSDPTIPQFVSGMKTVLVQQVSAPGRNSNCVQDDGKFLSDLAELIETASYEPALRSAVRFWLSLTSVQFAKRP